MLAHLEQELAPYPDAPCAVSYDWPQGLDATFASGLPRLCLEKERAAGVCHTCFDEALAIASMDRSAALGLLELADRTRPTEFIRVRAGEIDLALKEDSLESDRAVNAAWAVTHWTDVPIPDGVSQQLHQLLEKIR